MVAIIQLRKNRVWSGDGGEITLWRPVDIHGTSSLRPGCASHTSTALERILVQLVSVIGKPTQTHETHPAHRRAFCSRRLRKGRVGELPFSRV